MILPATIVQRNEAKFVANKLGDEMVMMDMDSGDFISLNRVGADIWGLCALPLTVEELVTRLLSLYDISREQCSTETISFLQNSMEQQMFLFDHPK